MSKVPAATTVPKTSFRGIAAQLGLEVACSKSFAVKRLEVASMLGSRARGSKPRRSDEESSSVLDLTTPLQTPLLGNPGLVSAA